MIKKRIQSEQWLPSPSLLTTVILAGDGCHMKMIIRVEINDGFLSFKTAFPLPN